MASKEQAQAAERYVSRCIAQRETGPWTDENAAALNQWLGESTLHRVVYYRLHAAWEEAGRLQALGAASSRDMSALQAAGGESALCQTELGERVERRRSTWQGNRTAVLRSLAAIIVLAVGVTLLVFRESLFHFNTYHTVIGGLEAVPMADGSRVTLNTDSTLRISLSQEERDVDLEKGEAFFEVAKDPKRPFVVRAGGKRIVAVGTQFSVRRDGEDVRVRVTQGTVRLETEGVSSEKLNSDGVPLGGEGLKSAAGSGPGVKVTHVPAGALLLSAGAIARAQPGGVLVQQKSVPEVEQELTWRSGILTFHDTPLSEAVAEFNRYNAQKIVILDSAVGAIQVGGIFGATQPSAFVHLLESGFPIQVSEGADQITLSAK